MFISVYLHEAVEYQYDISVSTHIPVDSPTTTIWWPDCYEAMSVSPTTVLQPQSHQCINWIVTEEINSNTPISLSISLCCYFPGDLFGLMLGLLCVITWPSYFFFRSVIKSSLFPPIGMILKSATIKINMQFWGHWMMNHWVFMTCMRVSINHCFLKIKHWDLVYNRN